MSEQPRPETLDEALEMMRRLLRVLLSMRDEMRDSEMRLTDAQLAHLNGEIAMLRRIIETLTD